jgi:hypothetical protein
VVSVDGWAVRLSILNNDGFTPQGFSLARICIPSSIETISDGCFCGCRELSSVAFERGSHLSTFGALAFGYGSSLQSICIPSSTETVSETCFGDCNDLSCLTFESDSRLSTLGNGAFRDCRSLQSIL